MQRRGGEGQGRSILAARVRADSERWCASTTATSTRLGSAKRAHQHQRCACAPPPLAPVLAWPGGRARTTSTSVCDGRVREVLATGASKRRRMGHAAAARQSGIRVQNGTNGVAAARYYPRPLLSPRCGALPSAAKLPSRALFFPSRVQQTETEGACTVRDAW
jgi:hypothetical protein